MLSTYPINLREKKLSSEELAQAVRYALIAELDAINLYVQIAEATENEKIKKVFLDIAKEEKTHLGEFLAILKEIDPEQVNELLAGEKEVKELLQ